MSEPFLGELSTFSFNFAPKRWAQCNGQLLPINQNQALFSLLGTYYGGDGRVNFALPDLRGRVPIHVGQGHTQGGRGGAEAVALSVNELPSHAHAAQGRPPRLPRTRRTPCRRQAAPLSTSSLNPAAKELNVTFTSVTRAPSPDTVIVDGYGVAVVASLTVIGAGFACVAA
jgi:microcystin-dependent protein